MLVVDHYDCRAFPSGWKLHDKSKFCSFIQVLYLCLGSFGAGHTEDCILLSDASLALLYEPAVHSSVLPLHAFESSPRLGW